MSASGSSAAPKLGIIAGGGTAPRQLISACERHHREFFIIALEGQADAPLTESLPHAWLSLGAGEKLRKVVAEQGIVEIVMVGRVRRPSLTELKPDWLALKVLTKIGINMLGDDALLRGVGKAIEEETGAKLIGAHEVFADLLTPMGQLGKIAADDVAAKDIARGLDVAALLGRADVGQSVVVQQGIVLGVEAIEGTDALIARAGGLQREGARGVLVKIAKPQQDNRFDLPTIGPDTVAAVAKAGLRGVAVHAGRSLFLERERAIAAADDAGIFIIGIDPEQRQGQADD